MSSSARGRRRRARAHTPFTEGARADGPHRLLFSGYASQNVGFFESMRAGYPLGFTRMNLANVRSIAPSLVVPGSAGYRFAGFLEWTNPFLFPNLAGLLPRGPGPRGPGYSCPREPRGNNSDRNRSVVRKGGVSPLARIRSRRHRSDRLRRDGARSAAHRSEPHGLPRLADRPPGERHARRARAIRPERLCRTRRSSIEEYRRIGFRYGLGVLLPDGHERWIHFQFDPDAPRIEAATTPLRGAIASHRIAASI